jgi:tetratricopeptide (TPR) repeat protein
MKKLVTALALACLAWTPLACMAAAGGAEIVLLSGKGERRATEQTVWVNAAVNDKVPPGGSVRTLANSQMGVLMSDRTQIRLNQNSELQIKSLAETTQWTDTTVRLNAGRAWSQARPQAAPSNPQGAKPSTALRMETPTTTIGIRGTDWEVEVDPDGATRIAVLSGVVDVGNSYGAIVLGQGEGALAEPGKAPVKYQLVNPSQRVQWVSSWKPQPQRWAGADAQRLQGAITLVESGDFAAAQSMLASAARGDAASARVRADLLLYQGDVEAARTLLAPLSEGGRGDPLATALLARALARQDRTDEAQALLRAAVAVHPQELELLTAAGDVAVLQGDAAAARAAYLGALQLDRRSVDAWYGLGLIASERERVGEARRSLGEALKLQPLEGRAIAELAATDSFAGDLAHARELLAALLAREPSNYQGLTALGVVLLKSGHPQEALEQFMKAGVIEPRYARAWLYSGVAFYQMGETDRAVQAFAHAAALDTRDPLPHMFHGMVESDALDPAAAIAAAREAQQRIPFLKSLNPVASNQKGSGNVGAALAGFGLEEWADDYAARAYSPYWGASHLFLADRFTGRFNRNSELFQGYLTEPTAFGASNRRNSLVTAPGHYGRIDVVADRTDWDQFATVGTVNGLVVDPVPFAYFASADIADAKARDGTRAAHSRNVTVGLGMKPTYQLGVFAFATALDRPADANTPELPGANFSHSERRVDLGFNYKLQPDNQFWLKAGSGSNTDSVSGAIFSPALAASLNDLLNTTIFMPLGTLDAFASRIRQDDLQLRHTFTQGIAQWSWGVEHSRRSQDGVLDTTFTPVQIGIGERLRLSSDDVWLTSRVQPNAAFQAEAGVFLQDARIRRIDTGVLNVMVTPLASLTTQASDVSRDFREANPRFGLRWEPVPLQTWRAVYQRWRKPASVATLAPVDTLGIALNDRLVAEGGLYERGRLQFDGEFGRWGFVRAWIDHERVDNGLAGRRSAISDFQLTQLENLRARPDVFEAKPDLEDTPLFVEGRVNGAGLAWNAVAGRHLAVAARYLYRDAEQTGALAGLRIPYVPRHFAQFDAQYAFGGQWLWGASATWRSERFRDDTNTELLHAGWAFAFTAYWESLDRRSSVEAIVGNLVADKQASKDRGAHLMVRYAYRF